MFAGDIYDPFNLFARKVLNYNLLSIVTNQTD